MTAPIIGIVCCNKVVEQHPSQSAHDKFIRAVTCVGGVPVLLPSQLAEHGGLNAGLTKVLSMLSGVLLTGSLSNVAPARYDAEHDEEKQDLKRDALTFSILHYALAQDLPVLGICRGHQELNVAMGGTLHPKVHKVEGMLDHREDDSQPLDVQYSPLQHLNITGDWLKSIAGVDRVLINSLHGQGIKDVGNHLSVEAQTGDGLIECIKATDHPFAVGVQWHPEWQTEHNDFYRAILRAFVEAASAYAER